MTHMMKRMRLLAVLLAAVLLLAVFPVQIALAVTEFEMAVQGTVTDDKGSPLSGYAIKYVFQRNSDGYREGGNSGWVNLYSDPSGQWNFTTSITGYDASDWMLVVEASKNGLSSEQVIAIQPGETVTVPLTVDTHETFIVHITDESGNPAPAGVPYWFTYVSPYGSGWPDNAPLDGLSAVHYTDSGGTISFESTGSGSAYPAGKPSNGIGPLYQTGDLRYEYSGDPTGLTVHTPRGTTEKTIQVKPLGKITATAKDSATDTVVTSAGFTVSNSTGTSFNKYKTVADGVMSVYGYGDLTISASAGSDPALGVYGYESASVPVTPTPWGEKTVDISMVPLEPGTIQGLVTDSEGNPVSGATVYLYWYWSDEDGDHMVNKGAAKTSDNTNITTSDGAYSFTGVIPSNSNGYYVVRAVKPGYSSTGSTVPVESGANISLSDIVLLQGVKYATNVTGSDTDTTYPGVDGRDFHVAWIPADSELATSQKIFIVPNGTAKDFDNWTPVFEEEFSSDPRTGSWTGTAALTQDSAGENFIEGNYDIYVVTYSDETIDVGAPLTATAEAPPSAPDLSWSAASDSGSAISGSISHVAAGSGGKLVAINGSGKLIVSGDQGQNWSPVDTGSFIPNDVVFDGTGFIAAGNGIRTSADGASWSDAGPITGVNWSSDVIYAVTTVQTANFSQVTVACGNHGLILVKHPAEDWWKLNINNPNASLVTFGHEFSYVPAHSVTIGGTQYNIPEEFFGFGSGMVWSITEQNVTTHYFTSVSSQSDAVNIVNFTNAWYESSLLGPGRFFALKNNGAGNGTMDLMVSDRGLTDWTFAGVYPPINGHTESGAGILVKVGGGGMILTSGDGSTWNSQTVGTDNLNDVIYAGGIFVAVGDHGTILASADGASWSTCTSGTTNDLTSVAYAGGTFVASSNGVILRSGEEAPAGACAIGATEYPSLDGADGALAVVNDDETITLLKNIIYSSGLIIENNKTFTIDLNGHFLTASNSDPSGTGLYVKDSNVLLADSAGGGKFYVISSDTGVEADNGSITVTNVTVDESGSGIGVYAANNGKITVSGDVDVTGDGSCGVWAEGGEISVLGDVTASTTGVLAYADSSVAIEGNVTASGVESDGAYAEDGGEITIDGTLTGGQHYINIQGVIKSQGDWEDTTTREGYYTYTDGVSTVWIKNYDASDVAAAKAALTFDIIKGSNSAENNITSNLNLIIAGTSGTAISWASSDPSTIATSGAVTRPAQGSADVTVTLTATITKGTASDTKTFNLTVRAIPAPSTGGGGGGSSPPATPVYHADVNAGHGSDSTLTVTDDKNAGSAGVDISSGGSLISGGAASVITVPSIPDVDTYTLGVPVPSLSTPDQQGALTFHTVTGDVTVPSNMLTGVAGISGNKAVISIGEGDKAGLPEDVKAAVGDRPLVQLTLSIDGKQTDWSNPDAPVTVSIPYTPTTEELLSPEHITIWYIDGSGNTVAVGGRYDPATGAVTFITTHFSLYAVVYDPVIRLSGANRIETALAIAQAAYPGKIKNAVLATAESFPDALTGSVLAYRLNAPILLAGSSTADRQKVLDYLKANLEIGGTVYILGGTGVIGQSFEEQLSAIGITQITRLAGKDRYETSVKIAEALETLSGNPGVGTPPSAGTPAVLASGEDYPDALAVSSIAARNGWPIFLVQKDGISDAVRQKISVLKPGKVYLIGLTGAVSAAVENEAAQITGLTTENIVRIGGVDRYATSLAIAQYFSGNRNEDADASAGSNGRTVCVTTGKNFPDALAGSIYAAKRKAAIILTDRSLPGQTMDYIASEKPAEAVIFGGEAAVGREIEQTLKELIAVNNK